MFRFFLLLGLLTCVCQDVIADTQECFEHAAHRWHVNVNILKATALVESDFNPLARNPSSNALGEMQIHPWHLQWLKRYGIEKQDLLNACTNINVGTYILAGFIHEYGNNWRAVGAYGVGNDPSKDAARARYAALVQAAYVKLTTPHSQSSMSSKRLSQPLAPPAKTKPSLVVQE